MGPRSIEMVIKSFEAVKMEVSSTQQQAVQTLFLTTVAKHSRNNIIAPPRPWVEGWYSLQEYFEIEDAVNGGLCDISITKSDFEKACLLQLSSSSAAVPAVLLKTCRKQLRIPLYHLWGGDHWTVAPFQLKQSLWSSALSIHKGGSRSAPKQCRPVALTSHLIKIFERVLRKH